MIWERLRLAIRLCWNWRCLKGEYRDMGNAVWHSAEGALAGVCMVILWAFLLITLPALPLILWMIRPVLIQFNKRLDWEKARELVEKRKEVQP